MVTATLNSRLKINGLLAGILVSIALWTVNLRVMEDKANVPLLAVDSVLTPIRPYIADPNVRATAGKTRGWAYPSCNPATPVQPLRPFAGGVR
jgi:hypothetical protein